MRAPILRVALFGLMLGAACANSTMPTQPTEAPALPTPSFSFGPGTGVGFLEDFSSAVLDPAWTVVTPARVIFPTFMPPNHHSLTDRPGFLRYVLDPWTHGDGFFNGYAPTFGEHSCCAHNAGLELQRTITGDRWLLESRAEFEIPFSNGRNLTLRVYFGAGGPGTHAVVMGHGRDVTGHGIFFVLRKQTGTGFLTSLLTLAQGDQDMGISSGSGSTVFYRVERDGGILTASWSLDGTTWTQAWSYDTGTDLSGLTQTVVLSGLMWSFLPTTYADWDYINVTPTMLAVGIDIMPGSSVNPVNPKKHGVIPVAILSAAGFDATTEVDRTSLTFGRTGAEASFSHCAEVQADLNGDGLVDLLCYFRQQQTGFLPGDTQGILCGETIAGRPLEGADQVRVKS